MTATATSTAPTYGTERRDLYQEVTNKIIAMLEKGVTPWRSTWSTYGAARNYATKHIYSGINFLLLNSTEHAIPYFLTFNQVKEQGGRVRRGASAEMVIYFNVMFKDQSDHLLTQEEAILRAQNGEEINVKKYIKYYNVFNIADIEGIQFDFNSVNLKPHEKIEHCENMIKKMPNCPDLVMNKPDKAYYSPEDDYINMPAIEQFETPAFYYATLFHELIHSTGHASRLAREEVINPQPFGSKGYSHEELVAELGASFLCASAQIDSDNVTENTAAYLTYWLKILKEDCKFIFKATAAAQKAADYILNRRQTGDTSGSN